MNESKKEWKVVDGYYPGFLNIVGASYTVSIVTSATDLTIEDYVNRTNDAHLMAAAPDLLEALENLLWHAEVLEEFIESERGRGRNADQLYADGEMHNYMVEAKASISKARGQQ